MRFKGIGKKIGDMAYKLTVSGCSCGGECEKCGICQNSSPSMSQDEDQSHEKRNFGDGMR